MALSYSKAVISRRRGAGGGRSGRKGQYDPNALAPSVEEAEAVLGAMEAAKDDRNPFDLPDAQGQWGSLAQTAINDVRAYYDPANFNPAKHRLLTKLPGWGDAMQQASREQMVRIAPIAPSMQPSQTVGTSTATTAVPPNAATVAPPGTATVPTAKAPGGTFTGKAPTSPAEIAVKRDAELQQKEQIRGAFLQKNFGVSTQQELAQLQAKGLHYGQRVGGGRVQQLTPQEKLEATSAEYVPPGQRVKPIDVPETISDSFGGARPQVPTGQMYRTSDGIVMRREVENDDQQMVYSNTDGKWISSDDYLEQAAKLSPGVRSEVRRIQQVKSSLAREIARGNTSVMRGPELSRLRSEFETRVSRFAKANPLTRRDAGDLAAQRQRDDDAEAARTFWQSPQGEQKSAEIRRGLLADMMKERAVIGSPLYGQTPSRTEIDARAAMLGWGFAQSNGAPMQGAPLASRMGAGPAVGSGMRPAPAPGAPAVDLEQAEDDFIDSFLDENPDATNDEIRAAVKEWRGG